MSAEHPDGLSEEAAEALSEQFRPSWEAPDPWATGDEGPTMAEEESAPAAEPGPVAEAVEAAPVREFGDEDFTQPSSAENGGPRRALAATQVDSDPPAFVDAPLSDPLGLSESVDRHSVDGGEATLQRPASSQGEDDTTWRPAAAPPIVPQASPSKAIALLGGGSVVVLIALIGVVALASRGEEAAEPRAPEVAAVGAAAEATAAEATAAEASPAGNLAADDREGLGHSSESPASAAAVGVIAVENDEGEEEAAEEEAGEEPVEPERATLALQVFPLRAEVEVDGERWEAPFRRELPVAETARHVVVRLDGFETATEDVVLSEDETVRIRLVRESPAASARAPTVRLPPSRRNAARATPPRRTAPRLPARGMRRGGGFTTSNPY